MKRDNTVTTESLLGLRSEARMARGRRRPLTIRLSDAGARCRQPKLIYQNHRPSPWLTDDAPRRSLKPIVRVRVDARPRRGEPETWILLLKQQRQQRRAILARPAYNYW